MIYRILFIAIRYGFCSCVCLSRACMRAKVLSSFFPFSCLAFAPGFSALSCGFSVLLLTSHAYTRTSVHIHVHTRKERDRFALLRSVTPQYTLDYAICCSRCSVLTIWTITRLYAHSPDATDTLTMKYARLCRLATPLHSHL